MKILIVEDEKMLAGSLVLYFKDWHGADVKEVKNVREAKQVLETWLPDIILLDYFLDEGNGDELVGFVKRKWPEKRPYLVLMTAASQPEKIMDACQPDELIKKPFALETLDNLIHKKMA